MSGPPVLDPAGVAALLRPGMRVFMPAASGEPSGLLAALAEHPEATAGVEFTFFPLPGMNSIDPTAWHPEARARVFFLSPALRDGVAAGRVQFVPMQMRAVHRYLRNGPRFDLVLASAAPAAADGRYPLAPNVDFVDAAIANADTLVLEVNAQLPAIPGVPRLDPAAVDAVLPVDHPLPELPQAAVDDTARAIGREVAALVPDGACLQTGIGAIPQAVLGALHQHNDLGLHSGLLDAAGRALIDAGVLTGARKNRDPRVHTTGMALGDAALYAWLAERPEVRFAPADTTHEFTVLAALERFVSVNSAVEIDLYGQVNAEMVGTRQISGTGGSLDFMRGAAAAPGGRSILALTSTARGGSLSRIVPHLAPGTVVTASRTDLDWVVTEHGARQLAGLSLRDRALALAELAAPDFRDDLRNAARAMGT